MMNQGPYEERTRPTWQTALNYVACYVIWIAYGALSFWTILEYRDAVLSLLPVIGPWVMGAVDKFGLLFFGLAALIWVLYLEHYLRTGVELNRFWRRVLIAGAGQGIVLGVAVGLQVLADLLV
jgi:hypothetical protein